MLEKLNIKLATDECDLKGRALLKVIMCQFLPARQANAHWLECNAEA